MLELITIISKAVLFLFLFFFPYVDESLTLSFSHSNLCDNLFSFVTLTFLLFFQGRRWTLATNFGQLLKDKVSYFCFKNCYYAPFQKGKKKKRRICFYMSRKIKKDFDTKQKIWISAMITRYLKIGNLSVSYWTWQCIFWVKSMSFLYPWTPCFIHSLSRHLCLIYFRPLFLQGATYNNMWVRLNVW